MTCTVGSVVSVATVMYFVYRDVASVYLLILCQQNCYCRLKWLGVRIKMDADKLVESYYKDNEPILLKSFMKANISSARQDILCFLINPRFITMFTRVLIKPRLLQPPFLVIWIRFEPALSAYKSKVFSLHRFVR